MEERKCPECGDKIVGRIDKRFCCDQCRNNFNNRSNRLSTNYMRQQNAILTKNRRILESFNPEGKSKVQRDKLLKKGFSFEHVTRLYKTRKEQIYYFCYEYGYLELDNGWLLLVKQDVD